MAKGADARPKTLVNIPLTASYVDREKVITRMRDLANRPDGNVLVAVSDLRELLTALDVSDWSRG